MAEVEREGLDARVSAFSIGRIECRAVMMNAVCRFACAARALSLL